MKFTAIKKLARRLSVAALACITFAGAALADGTGSSAAGSSASGSASGSTGMLQFVASMVILFAIFYFLMIRPENKRKKKVEEMRSGLKNGDEIVTIGGIRGKIVSIAGDYITFETGEDRVRIQVAKWAISDKSGRENKQ